MHVFVREYWNIGLLEYQEHWIVLLLTGGLFIIGFMGSKKVRDQNNHI